MAKPKRVDAKEILLETLREEETEIQDEIAGLEKELAKVEAKINLIETRI